MNLSFLLSFNSHNPGYYRMENLVCYKRNYFASNLLTGNVEKWGEYTLHSLWSSCQVSYRHVVVSCWY